MSSSAKQHRCMLREFLSVPFALAASIENVLHLVPGTSHVRRPPIEPPRLVVLLVEPTIARRCHGSQTVRLILRTLGLCIRVELLFDLMSVIKESEVLALISKPPAVDGQVRRKKSSKG